MLYSIVKANNTIVALQNIRVNGFALVSFFNEKCSEIALMANTGIKRRYLMICPTLVVGEDKISIAANKFVI